MDEIEHFQGFFSYAHHDAKTDPDLIEALTLELEERVRGKLVNANFTIWRDNQNLRTGDRWDDRIAQAVRSSSLFIILLTPSWIGSAYCRKEYSIFVKEVEAAYEIGEYVFTILSQGFDQQIEHFDPEQVGAYQSLKSRQYKEMIVQDFLISDLNKRRWLVDKLADDLTGMVERARRLSKRSLPSHVGSTRKVCKPLPEFNSLPHNIREVDFINEAEVIIDKQNGDQPRAVLAYVGFVEHLYVQTAKARVEFGVRRFFLSIDDGGTGKLERVDELRTGANRTMRYVKLQRLPNALTVCVTAEGGYPVGPLPMVPAEGENYLARVASLASNANPNSLRAELAISLSPEGIFISGEEGRIPSPRTQKKIEAIMCVLSERNMNAMVDGILSRSVCVRER